MAGSWSLRSMQGCDGNGDAQLIPPTRGRRRLNWQGPGFETDGGSAHSGISLRGRRVYTQPEDKVRVCIPPRRRGLLKRRFQLVLRRFCRPEPHEDLADRTRPSSRTGRCDTKSFASFASGPTFSGRTLNAECFLVSRRLLVMVLLV